MDRQIWTTQFKTLLIMKQAHIKHKLNEVAQFQPAASLPFIEFYPATLDIPGGEHPQIVVNTADKRIANCVSTF